MTNILNFNEFVSNHRSFISETSQDGKNGHWLYTVSGGKETKTWVDYDEIVANRKKVEKELEDKAKLKAAKKEKKEKNKQKIEAEISQIEDEMIQVNTELKDLKREHRQLLIDMEEEVGGLYVSGKEAEGEALAQEYGDKLNKIEDKTFSMTKKYEKLKNRYYKLQDKLY